MLPPDLAALTDTADQFARDAHALTGGLSDAQANWQPGGGTRWSIAQCLDHLGRIDAMYTAHFRAIVERARAERRGSFVSVSPTRFGRMFVRSLEPPPRQRLNAPASVAPPSSIPIERALSSYLSGLDAYKQLVAACADIDVNRVTGPNPFARVIPMRVATALLVIPAHDRRHLWQAEQVRRSPDFPV